MKAMLVAGLILALPAMAIAEDSEDEPKLRELVTCFPAKGITEFVSKFQNIDADKRDTVDMLFAATFKVEDGGVLPARIFTRDNSTEKDFTLQPDGSVPDFKNIASVSETAELCSEDPTRVGTPHGETSIKFSLTSDVHFLSNDGYHDLPALEDGLKDGKTHYKKMMPAAMRMLVPSLKYVMIEYEAEDTPPQFTAMKGQEPVEGLEHETFCSLAMIKVKDIEKLGADGLKIMGGDYNLTPVPGRKTLERFTECSKDEEGGGDK